VTSILDEAGRKNGKLDVASPPAQPPKCPECTSRRVWRDGVRYTKNGDVQRYLCRSCGFRFSFPQTQSKVNVLSKSVERLKPGTNLAHSRVCDADFSFEERLNRSSFSACKDVASHEITGVGKGLNSFPSYNSKRQVCVNEEKMKNLVKVETRQKQAAGATKQAEIRGKIIEYMWHLKKQGYADSTVKKRTQLLEQLARKGANLLDPESVKRVIAAHDNWSGGYKRIIVDAYTLMVEMLGLRWNPPSYKRVVTLPFIPLEKEIDALIAGCSKKVAASLQTLKETAMRIGEVWQLRWTDVDEERQTIKCRSEKRGNPRMFKVNAKLIAMLNALPKTSERVFGATNLNGHRWNFTLQRRRLARKLQNPRLNQITFHTFRHWKATMEYHRTKDILHVMRLLGHRKIDNTLIYTHLVDFEHDDDFTCRAAKTLEEASELIEAGFDYVTDVEGVKLFRKRK